MPFVSPWTVLGLQVWGQPVTALAGAICRVGQPVVLSWDRGNQKSCKDLPGLDVASATNRLLILGCSLH